MAAFVSYVGTHKAQAVDLMSRLEHEHITTFDHDNTENFNMDEVFDGVEECRAFIFFLSKDFTKVRSCRQVLAYAMTLDKWVIPIVVEPLSFGFSLRRLLDGLWISDMTSANFESEFKQMLRTIKALVPEGDAGAEKVDKEDDKM